MTRRRLSGFLFLALAAVIAWGGTVDPAKASARWIFVALLAGWGLFTLFFERARDRLEQLYVPMIAMGLAIGSVGWLIPGSGSRGLLGLAALLVVLALGLWIWAWYRRKQAERDDSHRPR